jgi:hypothetical protein
MHIQAKGINMAFDTSPRGSLSMRRKKKMKIKHISNARLAGMVNGPPPLVDRRCSGLG